MFGWFKKKQEHGPKERLIYSFWNGERMVHADPLVLHKRLREVSQDLSVSIKVAKSISKDAVKEDNKAIKTIRGIFGLKSPEPGSIEVDGILTEVQVADLLDDFVIFCDQLKKNMSPPATTTTAPSLPGQMLTGFVPPIPPTSAFNSTSDVPSAAVPEPLPGGHPSPLAS